MARDKVQNISAWSEKSSGPAQYYASAKPASMMAEGAAKGMPKVSKGIIEPKTALLLADSGPATPSIAPWQIPRVSSDTLFSIDRR